MDQTQPTPPAAAATGNADVEYEFIHKLPVEKRCSLAAGRFLSCTACYSRRKEEAEKEGEEETFLLLC